MSTDGDTVRRQLGMTNFALSIFSGSSSPPKKTSPMSDVVVEDRLAAVVTSRSRNGNGEDE